jgi:hypothetical protein
MGTTKVDGCTRLGMPVYVLDNMISDGKKLPRWTPRSTRTVKLGFSDKHTSSVPLVFNPQTGYITAQPVLYRL